MMIEGAVWPFPRHLDTLFSSAALKRMIIGRLTQALVTRNDKGRVVTPSPPRIHERLLCKRDVGDLAPLRLAVSVFGELGQHDHAVR